MKVCACFLLFVIFANTQSFAHKPEINPKNVNLVLRTVLEFQEKDKQSDIKLIDDIENVLEEIRTIIDEKSNTKHYRRNSRDDTLTGFIQDAINIINTYEDTAFEDFFHILNAEITRYHYRGCKFSELTRNDEIENLITAKLDSIKGRTTLVKKITIKALSDVLKYEYYDNDVKEIVDYINSLYTQSGAKFRRFLSNLEGYGKSKSRSKTNLVKIIKNGLRSIIFDHYTNLSMNTRRYLRHQIQNFWRQYNENHPSKEENIAKVTPYNTKNSKITNEAKNLELDSRKYQKRTNNKINQKWINIKQSQHKNKITKKNENKRYYKNTRKETVDESFETQEKVIRQPSQNTDPVGQQWDEIKLQRQTGDVLVDSLSVSFNSKELDADQQDKTQQFVLTNVEKKPNIIDTLNVTTKTPTNNTIQKKVLWIEQSTGRLPKSVLDKLAKKASKSNPDLMGKNLNKYGPKHKKNKDQKWWHRKINKTDKTRSNRYETENAETHEKNYDPQNHKTLRYSELIRDKLNEKIHPQENEKTYGKINKQAGDKTRENINETDNDNTLGSSYGSESDKELENYRAKGKIYDKIHEPKRLTTHRFEFDSSYESKEDTKDKEKNLNPNKPTNIKRYKSEHGKTTHPTFPQSNSSIRWLHVQLPLKTHSKINSRKSTEYSTSLKEGITAGNIEIIDYNTHIAQTTSFSNLKDSFERQLNQGISIANDSTEEGRKETQRYVVKPKQLETMPTLDDTLRQDTSKMAVTADHETDLSNYVPDKDSKSNDYDEGITVETRFRSGVNMIPVDFKLKDELKTAETAVNKTEFSIEDYKDKYDENNIENGKKSEIRLGSGFEMPSIDNIVRHNVTGAANNEKDFTIEHVEDEDSKNNENKIEKADNFEITSRSNANNNFKVRQKKLNMAETSVNKIEHVIENKYIQDKVSTNNAIENILNKGITSEVRFRPDFTDMTEKTEVIETADNITEYKDSINIENGKKSEINFTSEINMMPNDINDKTDQTNRRTADIKTDFIEKENNLKIKEDNNIIVDKDNQIYQVDDQTSIIREAPKEKDQIEKDTKQQYIDDVTFKAESSDMKDRNGETFTKHSENKLIMKGQKDQDDESKGTQTATTNIASTSSSLNGTKSTTKASATTVVLAAPTTP